MSVAKKACAAFVIMLASAGVADGEAQECTGENMGWCSTCETCPVNPSRTYSQPDCVDLTEEHEGMVLGYFDGCVEQLPCDEMIPCYDPQQEANTPEDVALLARALGGSAHEAQRMIAKYPGEITFDRDRNAVQIIGCNDAVKAHLPLQPAVAQARPSRLRGALTFVAGVVARARYLATTLA